MNDQQIFLSILKADNVEAVLLHWNTTKPTKPSSRRELAGWAIAELEKGNYFQALAYQRGLSEAAWHHGHFIASQDWAAADPDAKMSWEQKRGCLVVYVIAAERGEFRGWTAAKLQGEYPVLSPFFERLTQGEKLQDVLSAAYKTILARETGTIPVHSNEWWWFAEKHGI